MAKDEELARLCDECGQILAEHRDLLVCALCLEQGNERYCQRRLHYCPWLHRDVEIERRVAPQRGFEPR